MSIPNEALQKLVQEIETQAIMAQREINVVKTTISSKQRDARLLELTSSELRTLPKDTKVYEGVCVQANGGSREAPFIGDYGAQIGRVQLEQEATLLGDHAQK
ncbi:hypothetical protein MMC17_005275 [Xylographa soralifera]|nr:hypothetical protein [Xylographa soralifera]